MNADMPAAGDTVQPSRGTRLWLIPLLAGVVGFAALHPFDAEIQRAALRVQSSLGGDLRREWQSWQQYGQATAIAVVALIIWLLDAGRRRRLWDLALALVIAQAVSVSGKMLIGRPRPRPEFNDPRTFLGPWGQYPIGFQGRPILVHAWDPRAGTDLWSMPSSHTLFAAVLSVFLAALYPRLRWLLVALTAVVALGRLVFDAHWATDVAVGAAAGWLIGRTAIHPSAGVRLATRLTSRLHSPPSP